VTARHRPRIEPARQERWRCACCPKEFHGPGSQARLEDHWVIEHYRKQTKAERLAASQHMDRVRAAERRQPARRPAPRAA
jgi:hypothetical protein